MSDLVVREYGPGVETVIALHGGPAAAGDLAPLARELGRRWHVLEPFQRGSGGQPLSVATHVRDLDDLVRERCGGRRPFLLGHSWGAMLALAYAAEHPAVPAGLILIGCGTFSAAARLEFQARLEARLTPGDRAEIEDVKRTEDDPDRRLAALGRLMRRVYGYDLEDAGEEAVQVDAVAHEETWADMLRLQRTGTYPAAFGAIRAPVVMLHGAEDPHPGTLIRDDLKMQIPHLEYHEIPKCGHSPWLERQARQLFFETLTACLAVQCRSVAGGAG